MGEVVDLKTYHLNQNLRRGLSAWQKHFKEPLSLETSLSDLSNETLLTLARLQGDRAQILHGLIMGFLGLGSASKFHYLDGETKLKVLDIYFFVADQIRWECMRRLGWVQGFAGEQYTLIELVVHHQDIKNKYQPKYPQLNQTHPDYEVFRKREQFEGEVVVRRLIPAAIALLEERSGK